MWNQAASSSGHSRMASRADGSIPNRRHRPAITPQEQLTGLTFRNLVSRKTLDWPCGRKTHLTTSHDRSVHGGSLVRFDHLHGGDPWHYPRARHTSCSAPCTKPATARAAAFGQVVWQKCAFRTIRVILSRSMLYQVMNSCSEGAALAALERRKET